MGRVSGRNYKVIYRWGHVLAGTIRGYMDGVMCWPLLQGTPTPAASAIAIIPFFFLFLFLFTFFDLSLSTSFAPLFNIID